MRRRGPPHEDERDAKWQRRDTNEGAPGKGRGAPKRDREPFSHYSREPYRGTQRGFLNNFRSHSGGLRIVLIARFWVGCLYITCSTY